MRERAVDIPLDEVVLTDVLPGDPVDLRRLAGAPVVTLIRHRY